MNGAMEESADASSSESGVPPPNENGHDNPDDASNRDGSERRFDPLAESGDEAGAKSDAPDCSNDSGSVPNFADADADANAANYLNSNDSVNSDSIDGSNNARDRKAESASDERDRDGDEDSEVHEIRSDSENDDENERRRRGDKALGVDEASRLRFVRDDRPPFRESDEEVDSEEDSSDEEGSEPDTDDGPVSIRSDSEPEAIGDDSSKGAGGPGEVLLVDDASNDGKPKTAPSDAEKRATSPTIHEIASDNDDCVVTDEKSADGPEGDDRSSVRRSSRIMDKKSYRSRKYGFDDYKDEDDDDEESDVEEIVAEPSNRAPAKAKGATIVINNTKKLVDLAAIKQNGKSNGPGGQKKEPTVVIIDTNSILTGKTQTPTAPKVPFSNLPSQTLYESMAARGTTVTPLSAKPQSAPAPAPAAPAAPILPSLTDDMFVVEAPSFIVPYVYEKPSLKPFREFVDILGKELDERIKKEERERTDREREIGDKLNLRRKEREAPAPVPVAETPKAKEKTSEVRDERAADGKKGSKKAGRRKKKDDDDASWDGESTTDSDDEGMSDDERPKTVIIKEKDDDSLDAIKDPMIGDLTITGGKDAPKTNGYFDNSLGKFFINIGMNLVQEFVQSDLLKQQKRKLQRENRAGSGNVKATELAINSLMKNLDFSKENNAPYKFDMKKCEFCSFKTESALALAHHMETPHMKNFVYKCNFCPYEVRSPHDILFHMEAEHNTRGRLERAPSYHQCPNCPFEDNGKGKLGRHLIACAKKFRPDYNLMPPIDWEPPAKIPKATHVRQNMMSSYQTVFAKMQASSMSSSIIPQINRGRGRPQMLPSLKPVQGTPLMRGGVLLRQSTPNQSLSNYHNAHQSSNHIPKALQHQPSISITPLPRTTQSTGSGTTISAVPPVNNSSGQNKSTFVICEICDGYIKDLEQLRNHMQWIHKVKIHPKMIYNRPPLNCQKCQFRFFTDQGLERHLLGSHGLVTSSMQEAANKSNDSGRCPICGRVYQWKLLNHVARDHNLTLKPAHLSYKCTVCTATFGMYRQFENHVYSAHSVVAKRAADKNKGPTSNSASSSKVTITPGGSLLKPIN